MVVLFLFLGCRLSRGAQTGVGGGEKNHSLNCPIVFPWMSPPQTAEADQTATDLDLRVPCYCEENAWRLAYRHLRRGRWSLADRRDDNNDDGDYDERERRCYRYHVVFISNDVRCCPFHMQRAARSEDGYVCWDYHVVVIREVVEEGTSSSSSSSLPAAATAAAGRTEVLDVDTRLCYPCPLQLYLEGSFPHAMRSDDGSDRAPSSIMPYFRVVPARQYLKYFYSDRMHMFKNGRWSSPPPHYEPIMNGLSFAEDDHRDNINKGSNLQMYISMSDDGCESSAGQNNVSDFEERWGKVYSLDQFYARFR